MKSNEIINFSFFHFYDEAEFMGLLRKVDETHIFILDYFFRFSFHSFWLLLMPSNDFKSRFSWILTSFTVQRNSFVAIFVFLLFGWVCNISEWIFNISYLMLYQFVIYSKRIQHKLNNRNLVYRIVCDFIFFSFHSLIILFFFFVLHKKIIFFCCCSTDALNGSDHFS